MRFPIQKLCKVGSFAFFLILFSVHCGNNTASVVESMEFDDNTVLFVDESCTVGFTMVNSSNQSYSLSFLTASFEDSEGTTFQLEMEQSELVGHIDPITMPGLGSSEANITFDLSDEDLVPPLNGTVIVIGVSGSQVAHFVGNFTCE